MNFLRRKNITKKILDFHNSPSNQNLKWIFKNVDLPILNLK